MISFVRSGLKICIVKPVNMDRLTSHILENLGGRSVQKASCAEGGLQQERIQLENIFKSGDEHSTVVFALEEYSDNVASRDVSSIFNVPMEIPIFMSELINNNLAERVRIPPRGIFMRTLGNRDTLIEQVKKDYNGSIEATDDVLQNHNSGTVVFFTEKNLNRSLMYSEVHDQAIHIDDDFAHVIKGLNKDSLKYINQARENEDWHEVTIKIYDSYEAYELHYRRLLHVFEKLGLGFVLGEGWGTDTALMFRIVGVYQVRLLTYHSPEKIKGLLMGLEFLEDDTRIVDYDLFVKRKKIHWDRLRTKEVKKREVIARIFREEIMAHLQEDEKQALMDFNQKILETRK